MKIAYFCWGCFNSAHLNHKNNGTNGFPIPWNLCVEPLIVIIWLQGTEIWHILTFWWLTWPMTLTQGVTLTHKNNDTNGFPVTENVGVETFVGVISGEITEIWHIFTCCMVADNDLWHWSRMWPRPWMTKIMPPTYPPYPKT